MIVLDTNVISEVMRPTPDASVLAWLRAQPVETLTVTSITLAEISYGLHRLPSGRRRLGLEEKFQTFIEKGFAERILPFDAASASLYGEIVTGRERAGRPMDALDAMIAAIVRARKATLATRNGADFADCGIDFLNPWAV